ncbi:hypothetical protein ACQKQD_06555 [Methylobacterium sp. NPDC080182]|uniref:hypothetical protein n=1 Tax=Methylobacterium sp. NPDC080182 TaxID=3390590 RepID=UPI003D0177B8
MVEHISGSDPPAYPPPHTIRGVKAWAIHHLNAYKPALPRSALTTGEARPRADTEFRRLLTLAVRDPVHRRQFAAWCTALANPSDRDLSFAGACKRNGWSESTAERNVDRALTALVLAFNHEAI